jgi:hypothetical protein
LQRKEENCRLSTRIRSRVVWRMALLRRLEADANFPSDHFPWIGRWAYPGTAQ